MKTIILDTNLLMAVGQLNVDIFSEIERICAFHYKLCILDRQIGELQTIIKEQKGKNKTSANLALQLIRAKNVEIIETTEKRHVDDLILEHAEKDDCIVATQDKILKKRVLSKGKKVIFLRQAKYLVLEGD